MIKELRVATFCGSKEGMDPLFMKHAALLGKSLAEQNITMVYGGGGKGLMGAIADSMMTHAGHVIGVIPEKLIEWEHQHRNISELIVVNDMHTRKKKMYEMCQVAIILPGGFGTLDELFEMLTWNQLAIHDKPIYILNTGGFYDHLISHMSRLQQFGFLYDKLEDRLNVFDEPVGLVRSICSIYIPAPLE
jgi:uncharacterized protein (TIGR00730 family)